MPRMIRARRTSTAATNTNQLQDQFIRQLTREAERTLREMSDQFNQDLERQSNDFLSGLLAGEAGGSRSAGNGFINLFMSAGKSLFNRPRTTEVTSASARSKEEEKQFRLSQSQWFAEASSSMARGNKNA